MDRPTLILDADDTLWENNIFYENLINAFADRLAREGFDRADIRQTLSEVEHERIPLVGYGPHEFASSMGIAYRRLCKHQGRVPRPEVIAEVEAIGRRVLDYPILLLDGVHETVARLHGHCRLLLLTKGDPATQQSKLDRSGLAPFFEAVHVVPEKGPEVLRDLIARYGLDPRTTWMVGNSPRSDINPALEAGIGAIYVPHPVPWAFEEVPIAGPERVVTLHGFSELLDLFPEPEDDR